MLEHSLGMLAASIGGDRQLAMKASARPESLRMMTKRSSLRYVVKALRDVPA